MFIKVERTILQKHFIAAISTTRVEMTKYILDYQSNIITLTIVLSSEQ